MNKRIEDLEKMAEEEIKWGTRREEWIRKEKDTK
jgi:hypothetical protein